MLINCVAYQDGKRSRDIDRRRDPRATSAGADCFVWVALRDATDAELAEMQEEFDLHPLAVEDAHHGHQRPKVEEYGDSLFAVLQTIEPDGSDLRVGEVDIFVGPNYVLSVRNRSERGSPTCARAASGSRSCSATARATCSTR